MICRICDYCKKLINEKNYCEITIRILKSSGNDTQDAIEQQYGDYCKNCISNGNAIKDLKSELKQWN